VQLDAIHRDPYLVLAAKYDSIAVADAFNLAAQDATTAQHKDAILRRTRGRIVRDRKIAGEPPYETDNERPHPCDHGGQMLRQSAFCHKLSLVLVIRRSSGYSGLPAPWAHHSPTADHDDVGPTRRVRDGAV
jgi:hypothetical protein